MTERAKTGGMNHGGARRGRQKKPAATAAIHEKIDELADVWGFTPLEAMYEIAARTRGSRDPDQVKLCYQATSRLMDFRYPKLQASTAPTPDETEKMSADELKSATLELLKQVMDNV